MKLNPFKCKKLTKDHIDAMKLVENGADVYGYGLAVWLRQVQAYDSSLIDILGIDELEKVHNRKFNGAEKLPYFGAILTEKGKSFLQISGI